MFVHAAYNNLCTETNTLTGSPTKKECTKKLRTEMHREVDPDASKNLHIWLAVQTTA